MYGPAKKKTLTISPKGDSRTLVNLAGTDAAFKALRDCQDAQMRQVHGSCHHAKRTLADVSF